MTELRLFLAIVNFEDKYFRRTSTRMAVDPATNMNELAISEQREPKLSRFYTLKFVGDWGGANFYRICAWLTQEFCDRAGPGSRTSIWSLRDGGMDGLVQLNEGAADLAILTPAALMSKALTGEGLFKTAMPQLRAIGTLP